MEEINLSTVKPDMRKILLIGKEGTGKTHFIQTMPKPIYMFSFDKGYLTLAGEEGINVGLCMDDNRYRPNAYKDFKKKFDSLRAGEKYKTKDGKEIPYATIALDNISFLSTYLFDDLQYTNNNIDKPGGFTVYGQLKSRLADIINQSIMCAPYIVCTALVKADKDDVTGEIFFNPDIIGSLSDEVGAWFDAVFYTEVDKVPSTGKKIHKLITVGERRQRAKIRVPSSVSNSIGAVETPDFQHLYNKITGGQKTT